MMAHLLPLCYLCLVAAVVCLPDRMNARLPGAGRQWQGNHTGYPVDLGVTGSTGDPAGHGGAPAEEDGAAPNGGASR